MKNGNIAQASPIVIAAYAAATCVAVCVVTCTPCTVPSFALKSQQFS